MYAVVMHAACSAPPAVQQWCQVAVEASQLEFDGPLAHGIRHCRDGRPCLPADYYYTITTPPNNSTTSGTASTDDSGKATDRAQTFQIAWKTKNLSSQEGL